MIQKWKTRFKNGKQEEQDERERHSQFLGLLIT